MPLSCPPPWIFTPAPIHLSEPPHTSLFPRWLPRILPVLPHACPLKQIFTFWSPPLEMPALPPSLNMILFVLYFFSLIRTWALWLQCYFWPTCALHSTCLPWAGYLLSLEWVFDWNDLFHPIVYFRRLFPLLGLIVDCLTTTIFLRCGLPVFL